MSKIIESQSDSQINGYYAEGSNLSMRAFVKAGTAETQRQLCDAAGDACLGVVYKGGYENKGVSILEKGLTEVIVSEAVSVGDRAILATGGQKAANMENSPNTTDDEVIVLGVFKSVASADGDVAVLDFNPRKIKNPYKTRKLVFTWDTIAATLDQVLIQMPEAGTITAVKSAVTTGITANDTNYWTEQLTNVTQSRTALEADGDENTTKATGGAGYTANTFRSFTLSDTASALVFAANDVFKYTHTKAASASDLVGKSLIIEYTKS